MQSTTEQCEFDRASSTDALKPGSWLQAPSNKARLLDSFNIPRRPLICTFNSNPRTLSVQTPSTSPLLRPWLSATQKPSRSLARDDRKLLSGELEDETGSADKQIRAHVCDCDFSIPVRVASSVWLPNGISAHSLNNISALTRSSRLRCGGTHRQAEAPRDGFKNSPMSDLYCGLFFLFFFLKLAGLRAVSQHSIAEKRLLASLKGPI